MACKAVESDRLTREEESLLTASYRAGCQQAKARLVRSAIGYVAKLAMEQKCSGIEVADLVQIGVIGLLKALKNFDPAKSRLTTYASPWIYREIKRHLNEHTAIVRLPGWIAERDSKLREALHQQFSLTLDNDSLDRLAVGRADVDDSHELSAELAEAMLRLSDDERLVVQMRIAKEPWPRVASAINATIDEAKAIYEASIAFLRCRLEAE